MGSDEPRDGRLEGLYRRYLGKPAGKTDVYLGFALFFGGLAIGVFGLVLYLASGQFPPEHSLYWQLRELAIVMAFVGLPAFVLSIVVLLPVDQRAVYAGVVGAAISGVAVAVFVTTYPQAWNVPGRDFSPLGLSIYSGGLIVLIAASGAALVAYHLERRHPSSAEQMVPSEPADDETKSEPPTEAEVKKDIESAVSAADITWGGVEQPTTRKLEIRGDSDTDLDPSGFASIDQPATTTEGEDVDTAVTQLQKLRGWEPTTAAGDGVDEQTTALRELRKESETSDQTADLSAVGKLLNRLGR